MPPREVLPLQLPAGATDGPTDDADGAGDAESAVPDEGAGDPQLDDLKPFERGPEITEVR